MEEEQHKHSSCKTPFKSSTDALGQAKNAVCQFVFPALLPVPSCFPIQLFHAEIKYYYVYLCASSSRE